MSWNGSFKQVHRWLSIAFTMGLIVVSVVGWRGEEPAERVYLLPLI